MNSATERIMERLRQLGDPEVAAHSRRFFKTGPGEYGEGDIFLGIRVPVIRGCAREFRGTGLTVALELLESPLHEARLLALIMMVEMYRSAENKEDCQAVYDAYLCRTNRINNWDLVDCSAEHVIGAHLMHRERSVLHRLAASADLWERRIAIMATFHFIRRGDFRDTLAIAETLLHDRGDLVHKAVGWMLREVGKRDPDTEKRFLDRHSPAMPRTMLRYAIERFPEDERARYLNRGKKRTMPKPVENPVWTGVDSHVDLIYDLLRHHPDKALDGLDEAWVTLPRLIEGGVRLFMSVFYSPDSCNGPGRSADYLRYLFDYAEKYLPVINYVRSRGELAAAFQGSGQPGALLLLENADPLLEYPPEVLKERGFHAVGLTHVGRNGIACGNAVEEPEGLTPAGRKLLADLYRLGFAIDTAHLSEPAFAEVADLFPGPLFSSHTGFRQFNDCPRNLSDQQIRTLISRHGVVGMAAAPGMISDDLKVGIWHVFHQIDWFVQRYGPDGIAIGSDMGGYDGTCHGFNDHRDFPRLAELLSTAGYPDDAVAAIMGGNWFRFFYRLLK